MSQNTTPGTLKRFRVTFSCYGINEVRELHALDAQAARETVERSFPPDSGWEVLSVEEVNPAANIEREAEFPFVTAI